MCWLLPDHYNLQPCPDSCTLHRLLHNPLPTSRGKVQTNRRVCFQKEILQQMSRCVSRSNRQRFLDLSFTPWVFCKNNNTSDIPSKLHTPRFLNVVCLLKMHLKHTQTFPCAQIGYVYQIDIKQLIMCSLDYFAYICKIHI